MSRIGKKPIELPRGVDVKVAGPVVTVKGPKGTVDATLPKSVLLSQKGTTVTFTSDATDGSASKMTGLCRSLVANMVTGVTDGFSKSLTLVGVGFRAAASGKGITLSLGYSHPIDFQPPTNVELKVDKQTTILISGPDKQKVGQVAATLRSLRAPEPYHGKGVRYSDEVIVTKVGKAAGKK